MNRLMDTNCVLGWREAGTPAYDMIRGVVAALLRQGDQLFLTPQNLIEFWSVATRPAEANGLGLTPEQAEQEVQTLERIFPLLTDNPAIFPEWRRLVFSNGVFGRQVHDARLVAVMIVHGVTNILSFNDADFRRYRDITVTHPRDVLTV